MGFLVRHARLATPAARTGAANWAEAVRSQSYFMQISS